MSAAEAAFRAAGLNLRGGYNAMRPFIKAGAGGAAAGVGAQFGYNALTGNQGGYKRAATLGFLGGAAFRGSKLGFSESRGRMLTFGGSMKSFGKNIKTGFSSLNM